MRGGVFAPPTRVGTPRRLQRCPQRIAVGCIALAAIGSCGLLLSRVRASEAPSRDNSRVEDVLRGRIATLTAENAALRLELEQARSAPLQPAAASIPSAPPPVPAVLASHDDSLNTSVGLAFTPPASLMLRPSTLDLVMRALLVRVFGSEHFQAHAPWETDPFLRDDELEPLRYVGCDGSGVGERLDAADGPPPAADAGALWALSGQAVDASSAQRERLARAIQAVVASAGSSPSLDAGSPLACTGPALRPRAPRVGPQYHSPVQRAFLGSAAADWHDYVPLTHWEADAVRKASVAEASAAAATTAVSPTPSPSSSPVLSEAGNARNDAAVPASNRSRATIGKQTSPLPRPHRSAGSRASKRPRPPPWVNKPRPPAHVQNGPARPVAVKKSLLDAALPVPAAVVSRGERERLKNDLLAHVQGFAPVLPVAPHVAHYVAEQSLHNPSSVAWQRRQRIADQLWGAVLRVRTSLRSIAASDVREPGRSSEATAGGASIVTTVGLGEALKVCQASVAAISERRETPAHAAGPVPIAASMNDAELCIGSVLLSWLVAAVNRDMDGGDAAAQGVQVGARSAQGCAPDGMAEAAASIADAAGKSCRQQLGARDATGGAPPQPPLTASLLAGPPLTAADAWAFRSRGVDHGPLHKFSACSIVADPCIIHSSVRGCIEDELCGWCATANACVGREAVWRIDPQDADTRTPVCADPRGLLVNLDSVPVTNATRVMSVSATHDDSVLRRRVASLAKRRHALALKTSSEKVHTTHDGAVLFLRSVSSHTCTTIVTRRRPLVLGMRNSNSAKMAYHLITETVPGWYNSANNGGGLATLRQHVWLQGAGRRVDGLWAFAHAFSDSCPRPLESLQTMPQGTRICYEADAKRVPGDGALDRGRPPDTGASASVSDAEKHYTGLAPPVPVFWQPANGTVVVATDHAGNGFSDGLQLTAAVHAGHSLGLRAHVAALRAVERLAERQANRGGGPDGLPVDLLLAAASSAKRVRQSIAGTGTRTLQQYLAAAMHLAPVVPSQPLVTIITRRNKRFVINEAELIDTLLLSVNATGMATCDANATEADDDVPPVAPSPPPPVDPAQPRFGDTGAVALAALEDMPVYEQVLLLRRTRVLVGVHGSGLINTLFMNAGGSVLQLVPYKVKGADGFFKHPADVSRVRYAELPAEAADASRFHWHFLDAHHQARRDNVLKHGSECCGAGAYFTFWINQDTAVDARAFVARVWELLKPYEPRAGRGPYAGMDARRLPRAVDPAAPR